MNRLLMQLLYLPVTVFMTTAEALGRLIGAGQRAVASNTAMGTHAGPASTAARSASSAGNGTLTTTEDTMFADNHDLSGDDTKNVLYSILFTKRDLEATLKGLTEDVVNYSTDGPSYAGLRIASFTATGKFKRPDVWVSNNYPAHDSPDELTVEDIRPDDRRYITFDFRVVSRFPKNAADYDRRQTVALEGIANNTKRL